jgi:hypothetical protein
VNGGDVVCETGNTVAMCHAIVESVWIESWASRSESGEVRGEETFQMARLRR